MDPTWAMVKTHFHRGIYTCLHTYISIYMYMYMYIYTYTYEHAYAYMYTHRDSDSTYIGMYIYIYVIHQVFEGVSRKLYMASATAY